MKTTIISSDWFTNENNRLDAKLHLSEGLVARRLLNEGSESLRKLSSVTSSVFMGPRFKRYYVNDPEHGLPFMGGATMQKSDLNGLKLISKKMTKCIDELKLEAGWTLVTRSGTIGQTAYTTKDFEGKTATEDVIRIIADKQKIKPGFLHAYLTSKYGYALLTQGTYGAVIQHIEPHHIADLPVPQFPEQLEQQIHQLITEAAELRVEANKNLKNSHVFFEQHLNFQPSDIPTKQIKTAHSIQLFQDRLDASFNINYYHLSEIVKKCGLKHVSMSKHIDRIFIPNRGKRNYTQFGLKYLSTSNISTVNPTRIEKYLSLRSPGVETLRVKKDWILIARSGQEILGSVFYAGEWLSDLGVNEHALRLVAKGISPRYIYSFLSSKFGKEYLRAGIFGSAILTINDHYVKQLLLPVLPEEEKKAVIRHVELFEQQFNDAIEKENQAITLVENEINSWQHSKYAETMKGR